MYLTKTLLLHRVDSSWQPCENSVVIGGWWRKIMDHMAEIRVMQQGQTLRNIQTAFFVSQQITDLVVTRKYDVSSDQRNVNTEYVFKENKRKILRQSNTNRSLCISNGYFWVMIVHTCILVEFPFFNLCYKFRITEPYFSDFLLTILSVTYWQIGKYTQRNCWPADIALDWFIQMIQQQVL
jgi:hypothetical protein